MKAFRSCKSDPELFQKVKESVSMQQVVEHYGLRMNQKGLCLCPFHHDKRPSLKVYPNGKGFYCFACGVGGDQISFVAKYQGIGNQQAAKELAEAFAVEITDPVTYRERREAKLKQNKRQEQKQFIEKAKMYLLAYYGLLCDSIRNRDEHFWEGLGNLTYVQYLIDCLEECPEKVYADKKVVRDIGKIEGRIAGWFEQPETRSGDS